MLAAIMKSPTDYNPAEPAATARPSAPRLVLDAMVETGAITPAQRDAGARPAGARSGKPRQTPRGAVFRRLAGRPGPQPVGPPQRATWWSRPPSTCRSEAAAEAAGQGRRRPLRQRRASARRRWSALDGQGRVRAYVGGVDYAASQFDRAARRPPPGRLVVEAVRLPDRHGGRPHARHHRWSTSR